VAYELKDPVWQFVDHWQTLITGLLALCAGIGTIWVTRSSAQRQILEAQSATKSARELSRKLDRAYLNAGWGAYDPATRRVITNINNDGKTPAFITRVAIKVVSWDEFQNRPGYPTTPPQLREVGYHIAPGQRGLPAPHVWDIWDGTPNHIFYGRVWYNDIFHSEHYTSFALYIDGGAAVSVERFPTYWEWT
jgi:hypothetical protein